MILHYYKSKAGNFGDDLNLWLWPRLLPDAWDQDDGIRFAGIGTIITADMPTARSWIVLGSGAGYGPPPRGFGGPTWTIMSVRGPLSARVLGLPDHKAVTDGALLLSTLPEFQPLPEAARSGTLFVPHHQALETGAWMAACRRAGLEHVDPTQDSFSVVERIRRARLVMADSMHAAIIADALRVPWIPVATSGEINTFKWLDWSQSMQVPYRPTRLPSSTVDEAVRGAMLPLHGQRYFITPATPETVMRHYDRAALLKRTPWWPLMQRIGERAYVSGIKRLMRSLHRTGITARASEARLDAAAEALRRAADSTTYLSEERMWRRRTEEMVEQVDALRAMTRGNIPRLTRAT